ncbi:MAG TPA: ABC transporter ATP-binding protein [Pirellulaceae bacterium]|nr:ABC transporter ATP-binding protein [Pirellulaceae bacterium]
MAELAFVGVSKVFPGGVKAVDRLDLTVADGELLVLVGPSGSGKTTTLRLLAGLEQLSSGEIRIGKRDATALAPRQRDLAMVFQQLGLYGHLTASENMAFSLRLRQKGKWFAPGSGERLSADEIDQRVRQTAALLGIDDLLGRKPAELSGGQQQRVALGRAIVRRPQALLLDEPLASLDVPTRLSLRRELKRLHAELKLTAIHVTHDQAEAMALGDRIAVMNAGRVEQVATAAEIYRRPATRFVAGFFGSQGMNFCVASDKVLAARPEDVRLTSDGSNGGVKVGTATVIDYEDLGESIFVRLRLNGADQAQAWLCRGTERPPKAGETTEVWVDRQRLHWFDAVTGLRVEE